MRLGLSSPHINQILQLEFVDGIPQRRNFAVILADLPSDSSVCDDLCVNVNFFTSVLCGGIMESCE